MRQRQALGRSTNVSQLGHQSLALVAVLRPRMIKAILFDWYETLVTERGSTPVRASSLGNPLGLDPSAFRPIWKQLRFRVVRGELSFATALTDIGVQLGIAVDPAVVREICAGRLREKTALFQQINPEVVAGLHHLRERGLRLAVVSNCFAEDVAAWRSRAVAPWFDATVCSCEVGAAKPEPAFTLRRSGGYAQDRSTPCLSAMAVTTNCVTRRGLPWVGRGPRGSKAVSSGGCRQHRRGASL